MIAFLRGTLLEKQAPWLVLDVAGVGYEIEAPMSVFYDLVEVGEALSLYVHQVVRDDALLLFGFANRFERDLFRFLIKVNGIGPKLGLSLLSGIEADQLVSCIKNENIARLVKIPGVGKKTAERLIVEMSDRLGRLEKIPGFATTSVAVSNAEEDAIAALESLGYKSKDALAAIAAIADRATLSAEQLIRQTLKQLAK